MNPMQQQMSPDMLMAMMTDPRASPQQRMAAMSALNTMKGGANAPAPPPQMTGDSTGVSTIDPAFMAAVRQEVMGQGPEAQPEIPQRQAAPEAPQDSTTQALMSGAADASRVAAMARGGAVRGYAEGGPPSLSDVLEEDEDENRYLRDIKRAGRRLGGFLPRFSGGDEGVGFDPGAVPYMKAEAAQAPEPLNLPALDALKADPPFQDYGVGTPYEKPITLNTPDFFNAPARRAEASAAAQAAPAAAQAPAPAVDPAVEAMNAQRQSESDAYKKRMEELLSGDQPLSSQDKYMALLKAGLGTMASASKPGATFLGSIGEGGMSGVQSLDELRKERAVNRMKQATLLQSQRGEELASEDRKTTAGIQQQLANLKKLEVDMEGDPNSPRNKTLADQGTYYRQLGAAAGKEPPTQLSQRLEKLAEIRAIKDPSQRAAAMEDFNTAVSPERGSNDFTVMNAVIMAGDRAVKNFNDSLSVTETVSNDPKILADIEKRREKARTEGQANAARLLKVSIPGAETAPPPKLTPDQQANYDAAKKAINEEGRDRNAVLERLRASGTPTTGL